MERILPGLLLAGFWLLLLLFGSIQLFCLVIIPMVMVAANEYVKMVVARKLPLWESWLLNCTLSFPVFIGCLSTDGDSLLPALLISFLIVTCYILFRYSESRESFPLFCRLVLGLIYIGFLGTHLVLLRYLPDGGSWLIIASAITACSDSGAYFVGRSIGKRKLCPHVSPNKTVEGAVGGLIAGLIGALAFSFVLLPSINWFFMIVTSLFLAAAGIVGDLAESVIKRGTATKDSGRCFAGHGGVLDRVDSLLFVGPILYYLLSIPGIL